MHPWGDCTLSSIRFCNVNRVSYGYHWHTFGAIVNLFVVRLSVSNVEKEYSQMTQNSNLRVTKFKYCDDFEIFRFEIWKKSCVAFFSSFFGGKKRCFRKLPFFAENPFFGVSKAWKKTVLRWDWNLLRNVCLRFRPKRKPKINELVKQELSNLYLSWYSVGGTTICCVERRRPNDHVFEKYREIW